MRPEPSVKYISPQDVFETIEKCDNKKLKITYCSLNLNDQCITTKKAIIKITKIHKNCGFIEGLILKDNDPYENIILKSSQILSIECVKQNTPPVNESIFDTIRKCNGLVRITQCLKLDKGICTDKKSFPFLVSDIDEKNKNIKGYRVNNNQPEYMVIDVSMILKVECINPSTVFPNMPWMFPWKP